LYSQPYDVLLQPKIQNSVQSNPFIAYSIPIQGLKIGTHQFKYTLDGDFYKHFEDSLILDGKVNFIVDLDKRSDMLIFDFQFEGYVGAICDRCTADINLPISGEEELLVKFSEEDLEDDEVIFIPHETSVLNLAQYMYEFSIMALPIINSYDCESENPLPCNTEVLKHIMPEDALEIKPNPIWDSLKDLKNNN
jgi:uncharacterized protein